MVKTLGGMAVVIVVITGVTAGTVVRSGGNVVLTAKIIITP